MWSINELLAATVFFVGTHLLLSSRALRPRLVAQVGEGAFRGLYSLVSLVGLAWMALAYRAAVYIPLWDTGSAGRWVIVVGMVLVCLLVVAGLTTRSPTVVGGEGALQAADPVPGILRITRHPFLCGVALWALLHLVPNGDLASLLFFGGFLVLAVGGMLHIDRRRAAALGSAWGPIALTTSRVPFGAIVEGRTQMDWAGIGWWRPLAAIGLYVALVHLHQPLIGVPPWP